MGYIQLNVSYYHPLYYKAITRLLKGICLNCLNFSEKQTYCPYCSKKFESAEIVDIEKKIILYV